jgi:hypothetical protein
VTGVNGFMGYVSLSASGLPSGDRCIQQESDGRDQPPHIESE